MKTKNEIFFNFKFRYVLLQKFINVKYDMEKGQGVDLKSKYNVGVFPTYLFITGNGEVVHRIVGAYLEVNVFRHTYSYLVKL